MANEKYVPGRPFKQLFAQTGPKDISGHRHRQAIGWLGILLAPGVLILSAILPTPRKEPRFFWESISSYYYSSATVIFVGVLTAMAFYLLTYRGYKSDGSNWDARLSWFAAVAALGVATFPCDPVYVLDPPAWWHDWMGCAHLWCAGALFISFAVFSLVLFRLSDAPKGKDRLDGKKNRDWVYLVCGILILVGIGWALATPKGGSMFLAETLSLVFFSISWLAKGRAGYTIVQFAARANYYRGHVKHLKVDVVKAFRSKS